MGKKDRDEGGRRVTVVLEDKLWRKVEKEIKERQKGANHQVTVAELFRELVAALP